MKIPKFCYQKAFWIMFSILIASSASAIAATNAQIASIDERLRDTENSIVENNTIRIQVQKGLSDINRDLDDIKAGQTELSKNQDVLKAQNDIMLKIICLDNNICG